MISILFALLAHRCSILVFEVSFDEWFQFSIHYRRNIRSLASCSQILDKLVWMEDVVAYLLPPFCLHSIPSYLLDFGCPLLFSYDEQFGLQAA